MGQRNYVWVVPVSSTYDGFLREIRQRVAQIVASRTLGPDGRPVRREIDLTQGNQSLTNTYVVLSAMGMQRADIHACFHTSADGRVERITFSPPRVVPIEPTTITASPPRPPQRSPTPSPGRPPDRGPESEGEVAGVTGMLSGGRMFYGIHTTRHNTMCYGGFDNSSDVCHGVETENTMALRLHYDRGMRDYMYLMTQIGSDTVQTDSYQTSLRIFTQRVNAGRSPNAAVADRVYREGAQQGHRELRSRYPDLPAIQ